MKTFQNLFQLDDYNSFLADHLRKHIDYADHAETFLWSIGGDVFVAETLSQVQEIIRTNDYFDIFEEINDSWIMAVVINNNSGGPTYFIPKDLMEEYKEMSA